MTNNTITSKTLIRASKNPVFITDEGKPTHVLLSFVEYKNHN